MPFHRVWVAMRIPTGVLVIGLILTACGSADPPADLPRSNVATGDGFTLAVMVDEPVVSSGDPIAIEASLAFNGPGNATLSGSGSGPVAFSVTRPSDGLTSGEPAWTGDCARLEFAAGEAKRYPFQKSGGFSGDEPNAGFLREYFSQPELRLPVGRWRVDVIAVGAIGEECSGPTLDLETWIVVEVTD